MKGESVAEYLAELRRLALMCEFANFLDKALCDQFMCGLLDEAIQHRPLIETYLTLTKALTLAQSMEMAQKDLKEIHPQMRKATCCQAKVHITYLSRDLFATDVWE